MQDGVTTNGLILGINSVFQGLGHIFARLLTKFIMPRSFIVEVIILVSVSLLTLIAGALTIAVMFELWRVDDFIFVLLFGDLVLLFALVLTVVRRILRILYRPESKGVGASFRVRIVLAFALFSVVPAIILTSFSLIFLDFGLGNWFSDRIKTTVEESRAVARAYLDEHVSSISVDAVFLARSVSSFLSVSDSPQNVGAALEFNARFRDISEAIIFRRNAPVLARYGLTFDLEFEGIPEWAFRVANRGEVALLRNSEVAEKRIRALISLDNSGDQAYLLVGRAIDPQVLSHMRKTEATVSQYSQLEGNRVGLQISFTVAFIFISLLVLFSAILGGIQFASSIWLPIERLISATARIGKGRLEPVDFPKRGEGDEIGVLNNAFNEMTLQLAHQRREILEASHQIDSRRRFSEAVLEGVSAGVVGLDSSGCIDLANRKAGELLDMGLQDCIGERLVDTVPAFGVLYGLAEDLLKRGGIVWGRNFVEDRVHMSSDGQVCLDDDQLEGKQFFVRISLQTGDDGDLLGYVVTFDDLTDLLVAQRQAAWSDIARLIAHEVKNPLTPIQLSAERLKRRYGAGIGELSEKDGEIFNNCIGTIVRQVSDIGALIDEFSGFARMPKAVMGEHDIAELCRETVFLEQNRMGDSVKVLLSGAEHELLVFCDRRQLSQMLINLIKNSYESIKSEEKKVDGLIEVSLEFGSESFVLGVSDNGVGFANLGRDWTRPYVSNKDGSSGLGLSVVRKIIEEHGGRLELRNSDVGADVRVEIPYLRQGRVGIDRGDSNEV